MFKRTLLLVSSLLPIPALANDSVAEKDAGGIILVHSDQISMEKEDLYVSPLEVRVNYVFRNQSGEDQTSLVAFPMPDIDPMDYMESDNGIPDKNNDNFMEFKVQVAGKEITPQLEMRALTASIDISDKLKSFGIPLNPLSDAATARLHELTPDQLKELSVLGAVRIEPDFLQPAWSLRSTYYWTQTFPANAALEVSHQYRPAVGGTFFTAGALDDKDYASQYCIDAGTQKALAAMLAKQPADGPMLLTENIGYILKTGANWMGSIGDFRLVVDKVDADSVVSFCLDGVKKISPTQFEVRRKDFWPDKDLAILIVRPPSD